MHHLCLHQTKRRRKKTWSNLFVYEKSRHNSFPMIANNGRASCIVVRRQIYCFELVYLYVFLIGYNYKQTDTLTHMDTCTNNKKLKSSALYANRFLFKTSLWNVHHEWVIAVWAGRNTLAQKKRTAMSSWWQFRLFDTHRLEFDQSTFRNDQNRH